MRFSRRKGGYDGSRQRQCNIDLAGGLKMKDLVFLAGLLLLTPVGWVGIVVVGCVIAGVIDTLRK